MPAITLQYYKTNTLTAIDGVSVAIWNSGDTAVVDSGVTNASGQLVKTLSAGTYTARAFKDGYTIEDDSFTVVAAIFTRTIYGDEAPYGAKTYEYYRDQIVAKVGNRTDDITATLILGNFNDVQEFLSKKLWEDLMTSTNVKLTNSVNTYSFSDVGLDYLNEIYSIRVNDSTDLSALTAWNKPLTYIEPLDWDTFIANIYPIVEDMPVYYTRRSKNIIFHSTPDVDYVINIVASVYATPVTGLSSTISFSNVDAILINLTTAYTWMDLQEYILADKYFKKVDDFLTPYEQAEVKKRYSRTQSIGALRAFLSK